MTPCVCVKRLNPESREVSWGTGVRSEAAQRSPMWFARIHHRQPVFNSFTDVKNNAAAGGDERQFVTTVVTESMSDKPTWRALPLPPRNRWSDAGRGDVAWVRVLADNNASPVQDCARPAGPSVARNTRLRVAVWDDSTKKRHVVRAWVTADNADPKWVTDVIAIRSEDAAQLSFNRQASWSYQQIPRPRIREMTGSVLESGGMHLGKNGDVGSCWDNRIYLVLAFDVR